MRVSLILSLVAGALMGQLLSHRAAEPTGMEDRLALRCQTLLESVAGPGKVHVAVTVERGPAQRRTESTSMVPGTGVEVARQEKEESCGPKTYGQHVVSTRLDYPVTTENLTRDSDIQRVSAAVVVEGVDPERQTDLYGLAACSLGIDHGRGDRLSVFVKH